MISDLDYLHLYTCHRRVTWSSISIRYVQVSLRPIFSYSRMLLDVPPCVNLHSQSKFEFKYPLNSPDPINSILGELSRLYST
jgi:hypothetical protein